MVFGGYAYAVNPRKAGIGLRFSYTEDHTHFTGNPKKDDEYSKYIDYGKEDLRVNAGGKTIIPFFIQLNENLLGTNSFTNWFVDIGRLIQDDHPPGLSGKTWDAFYEENAANDSFNVPTENTRTSQFSSIYTKYSSIINGAVNPSLSADYYITRISIGKTWGVFANSSQYNRWLTIGIGVGINYNEGIYHINLCDPYIVFTEAKRESPKGSFREGICNNKTELYSNKISNFSLALNIPMTLYSYIDDKFEVNLGQMEFYTLSPLHYEISKNNDDVLIPVFYYADFTFISSVLYF